MQYMVSEEKIDANIAQRQKNMHHSDEAPLY